MLGGNYDAGKGQLTAPYSSMNQTNNMLMRKLVSKGTLF